MHADDDPEGGPMHEADEAFSAFVVAVSPRLLQAAWLLTGDRHAAQDLVQTALIRTYRAWRRVRRDDAAAYARRVLVNAHIDDHRRGRGSALPVGSVPERAAAAVVPGVEARDGLSELLALLTERERRVVVLRYYLDLSEAAVADDLGVSGGTVRSTASRALAKLRAASAVTPETPQSPGAPPDHPATVRS